MQIHIPTALPVAALPVAALPAAQAAPASPREHDAFARLLSARQQVASRPPAPAPRPPAAEGTAEPDPRPAAAPHPPAASKANAAPRSRDAAPKTTSTTQPASERGAAAQETARNEEKAADTAARDPSSPDPAQAAWMTAALPPQAPAPDLTNAADAAATQALAADARPAPGPHIRGNSDAGDPTEPRAEMRIAADAPDAGEAARGAEAVVALEGKPGGIEPRTERSFAADLSAASPLGAVHGPGHADPAGAPPLHVDVPTPATAPAFREALGVQVSVLARDGVQHAELHLHPTDMGPVSVQIALDGTQARVDFGADSLATRHLIESGLPELAAALRDAGLTLAGGGVSQHSRGRSSEGEAQAGSPGADGRRVGAASGHAPAAARAVVRMPQGAVDLYA